MENTAYKKIEGRLQEADFYREAHRKIFGAMRTMSVRGIAIDELTLCECLESLGQLEEVGGRAAITALTDGIPMTAPGGSNIQHYARIVSDKATERRFMRAINETAAVDFGEKGKLGECLKRAQLLYEETLQEEKHRITVYTGYQLRTRDIEPRITFLNPIIKSKTLSMLYGWRGIGKSKVAIGIAVAVSCGGSFLKWKADKPRKVLYIDGEMADDTLKSWYIEAIKTGNKDPIDNIIFLSRDLLKDDERMPDLATLEGQRVVEQIVSEEDIKLVIIDNLSTLFPNLVENERESWVPVEDWLLALRGKGLAVLVVHHASKTGDQRGSSAHEGALDTSIKLKQPPDYRMEDGCSFQLEFTKARCFWGMDAKPFDARLETIDEMPQWTMKAYEPPNPDKPLKEQILELSSAGFTEVEIVRLLGLKSRDWVYKVITGAKKRSQL
jgi:hypothetical protein